MPPLNKKLDRSKSCRNKKKGNKKICDANNGERRTKSKPRVVKKKKSPVICDYCKKSFKNPYALSKHKRECRVRLTKTNPLYCKLLLYKCSECNKKFRFEKSYKEHLASEHSKSPGSVKCNECQASCPDDDTLQTHILKFHKREAFKCEHCDRTFVRHAHVLRHLSQKGCDGQGVESFSCEICNSTFSRKDNLIVHLRMQHISKTFGCKQCKYETRNFSRLINHVQITHSECPRHYECDTCGKVTSSRAAMTKHLEIHGEKKYECDVCHYSTFTMEVMRRHVFTHLPVKPYKCSLCPRSFIQRMQLERHLAKHDKHYCHHCALTFDSKASFAAHKHEHIKEKKLCCTVDGCQYETKAFKNETSLKLHMETHEKKYKCEVCSKWLPTEMNMRRHLATHSLERPRRCMYCVRARAYARGDQLVKHVRKVHADVFRRLLVHIRQVLGVETKVERVTRSELESVLTVLDAEAERILEGCRGENVLYGGMQPAGPAPDVLRGRFECPGLLELFGWLSVLNKLRNYRPSRPCELFASPYCRTRARSNQPTSDDASPLMSEEELASSLASLLEHLIDANTLQCFGWPDESVDEVLEKVIEQCGAKAADRARWTRVQRLRENAKHLFLYVVEDKAISRMLDTLTIDQLVRHILATVADADTAAPLSDTEEKVIPIEQF